jgi:hypothetical protein
MIDIEQLRSHAERIRASNVLGRSELMSRLFDFFVECTAAGKTPKEIEIAVDVFDKDARFEVAQDAMVRVYVHKLRRKLDDYYAGDGRHETGRLTIPRGEYKLVFETVAATAIVDETPKQPNLVDLGNDEPIDSQTAVAPTARSNRWLPLAAGVALLLALNVALWFVFAGQGSSVASELATVRKQSLWQDIVSDAQPVTIVVGDYYIFGELDTPSESNPESVRRLVREFNINSRNDLDRLLKEQPEFAERYMDLALRYLPVSSAFALHNIAPLIEAGKQNPRQVQMILASDLTPSQIRSSHIVYIGLLSGMGILRDIVFAGSQFKIGDTYDELVDQKNDKLYVSQSSIAINDNVRYRDYGYFSTFAGPNGKRIVILSGTRDVALMHTAEAVSRQASLTTLIQHAKPAIDFEALYAVDAIDHMNLDGELLLTNQLDTEQIWSGNNTIATAAIAQDKSVF